MANKTITVQWLADQVNNYTNKYQYFWSYGLLKDTSDIWRKEGNYNLLNEISQAICDRGVILVLNQL